MAYLNIKRKWQSQPPHVVHVDREGLGRGLQLLFNPAAGPVDLVTGRVWTPNGTPSIATSPLGKVLSFKGGGSDDGYQYTGYPEITGNVGTFFMWCPVVGAADTFGNIVFSSSTPSTQFFQITETNAVYIFGQGATGTINWFSTTNRSLVMSSDGTAAGCKVYLDGVDTGLTWSATPTAWGSGAKDLNIGRYSGGVAWDFAGSMLSVGYANRPWNAADARAFHDSKGNALYKATSRKIWIASAGGVSGTLATTNANDTLSASGTTTVTGSLARTNASDTSAASGTTTVTGSLAKTNANDTLSASGAVGSGVTGSLAYTNANDTSAASGTTTVTGSLSRQNASDTGAASGTTTVTGSLAKTNANDTLAASGFVGLITGTVAVTNADDTVSARGSAGNPVTSFSGGIYVSREDRAERRKQQRIELGIIKEEKAPAPALEQFEISNLAKKRPVLVPASKGVDLAQQEALNAELKRLIALQVESEEEEILKILMEL